MARRVENQLLLHQSYRTCNGGLLDILKKKKCKENVTKEKIFPPITFKTEQTNKQKKQKQNKTNPWSRFLISVINSGSTSFSIVLKLPLIFNVRSYYDTRAEKVKQSDAITNNYFRLNPNCVTVKHRYFIAGLIKLSSR